MSERSIQHERTSYSRFEIKDSRRLTFYAATFDQSARVYDRMPGATQPSYYTETIKPGSFKRTIGTSTEVIANVDHDPSLTFAKKSDGTLIMQEDPKGLFCSAWIPETPLGDSIIRDVESGELHGCSFRFEIEKARWVGDSCELEDVILHDVCVTGKPAYDNTEVHLRTRNVLKALMAKAGLVKVKSRILHTCRLKSTGEK